MLREYLYRAKHVQVAETHKQLISIMSPKLRGELSLQINGPWLTTVRFLQRIELSCMIRIALALETAVYVPTELLSSHVMYKLYRGTVVYCGKVVAKGSVFGLECIVRREDVRPRPARALAHLEVSQITGEELTTIINATITEYDKEGNESQAPLYPIAKRQLQWERIRLSLLHTARLVRAVGLRKTSVWDLSLKHMSREQAEIQSKETKRAYMAQRTQHSLMALGVTPADGTMASNSDDSHEPAKVAPPVASADSAVSDESRAERGKKGMAYTEADVNAASAEVARTTSAAGAATEASAAASLQSLFALLARMEQTANRRYSELDAKLSLLAAGAAEGTDLRPDEHSPTISSSGRRRRRSTFSSTSASATASADV